MSTDKIISITIKVAIGLIVVLFIAGIYAFNKFTTSNDTLEIVVKNDSEVRAGLRMQVEALNDLAKKAVAQRDSTIVKFHKLDNECDSIMLVDKDYLNATNKQLDEVTKERDSLRAFVRSLKRVESSN